MRKKLVKKLRGLFVCALCVAVLAVGYQPARAESGALTLLVPVRSDWIDAAAQSYQDATGVTVNIIDFTELRLMWRNFDAEYTDYVGEIGKYARRYDCDVVLTLSQPAEACVDSSVFVDMRELMASDPDFRAEDYYTGVIESYGCCDGVYTMPVAFDLPVVAASESAAAKLGMELPESIGGRGEFSALCGEYAESGGGAYVVADGIDMGAEGGGWVPSNSRQLDDMLIELCSYAELGEEPGVAGSAREIFADYYDYYSQSFELDEGYGFGNAMPPDALEMLRQGRLVFCGTGFDGAASLGGGGEYRFYRFPASAQDGIYHSVTGVSIVSGGQESAAWDFIKYLMSYEVQLGIASSGSGSGTEARVDYGFEDINTLFDAWRVSSLIYPGRNGRCPINVRAAEELSAGVTVEGESLAELCRGCVSPSYFTPSGGHLFGVDTRAGAVSSANRDIQSGMSLGAGGPERYESMFLSAQETMTEFFRGMSPYVRQPVGAIFYLFPLLAAGAAVVIAVLLALRGSEFRRMRRWNAGKMTERIDGDGRRYVRFAAAMFAAAALSLAGLLLCGERTPLVLPVSAVCLALLFAVLGVGALFLRGYNFIEMGDERFLVFRKGRGFMFTGGEIQKADWWSTPEGDGCSITVHGPGLITLAPGAFRGLERLKGYIPQTAAE